jgi:hypothetical protein
MIYARAHDQTVAEDYFAAMQRVEERLNILPEPKQDAEDEVVKVQTELFQLIEQLELPELRSEQRIDIACQLRQLLVTHPEHAPPKSSSRQLILAIKEEKGRTWNEQDTLPI